jgi:hypothetical protein
MRANQIPPGQMVLPAIQPMRLNTLDRKLLRAGALSLPKKLRGGRK